MKTIVGGCFVAFLLGFLLSGCGILNPPEPQKQPQKTPPTRVDTGNDVYTNLIGCQTVLAGHGTRTQDEDCIFVMGYIRAVYDFIAAEGGISASGPRTHAQMTDAVYAYLTAHPELRDRPAIVCVKTAFIDAYPRQ